MNYEFINGNERITQVQLLEKQDNCDLCETFEYFAVKKDFSKKPPFSGFEFYCL